MWKKYYTPNTLQQALELLNEHQAKARIISGGTDLIIEIERGLRRPEIIIDVSRIADLDYINLDENDIIHLGPTVSHNQVVGSALCRERAFPLAQACFEVGSPQIRNRGTVTGNLVTASPANDTISPLRALDAGVILASVNGQREILLVDFFLGVRKTVLQANEMVVDIHFPAMEANQIGAFEKLGLRRAQAISVVNVAVVLTMDAGAVSDARIALGSVAPTIVRAAEAETALVAQPLTDEVIANVARLAVNAANPIDDVRGSAAYRRYAVEVYAKRALNALRNGAAEKQILAKPIMLWGDTNGRYPQRRIDDSPHISGTDDEIVTIVNGEAVVVRSGNDKTLLRMLRENLQLTGTKEGCAEGECGACTVLLDGIAVMSCTVPAPRAHHSEIITIEGLDDHPIQHAFVAENAVQCGYCTPGFIMSGASLLLENPAPTQDEIKQAIAGNLCRCTGYYKILKAFETAATI